MKVSCLALGTLLLGVALFASAPALAQDHGQQDAHQTENQPSAAHAEPNTSNDEHAAPAHGETAGHGEVDHAAADGHGGGHGTMPHLPNALTFIRNWVPAPVATVLEDFQDPIFSLFMALMLALFFVWLSKRLDSRNPGRVQMVVELLFGGLYSLFQTIIGDSARRYTPYLGSLFIFILCNNLFGIIPLGHAATSSFANTTFALGIMTFVYVQSIALRENGIGGYLFHLAGSPRSGVEKGLVPLFFVLHLIGELIKPLSLSLRLFGNIFGEDTLVATMVLLGAGVSFSLTGGNPWVPGLPFQFPFYFLGLLSSTIQALVFTLLSTVYIALWLPHDHHDEAHGH